MSCQADAARSGATLDTMTPGTHPFTVQATDRSGNLTSVTRTYHVGEAGPTAGAPVAPPPVLRRPDGLIHRYPNGRQVGGNVYGSSARQRRASGCLPSHAVRVGSRPIRERREQRGPHPGARHRRVTHVQGSLLRRWHRCHAAGNGRDLPHPFAIARPGLATVRKGDSHRHRSGRRPSDNPAPRHGGGRHPQTGRSTYVCARDPLTVCTPGHVFGYEW